MPVPVERSYVTAASIVAVTLCAAASIAPPPRAVASPTPPFAGVPAPLTTPAAPGSGEPCLAVDPDGAVYMSWFEKLPKGNALKVSRLDGTRWSKPAIVASGDSFFVNWANFPSLVAPGGRRLAVAWPWKHGGSGGASDVRVAQSPDGGRTWGHVTIPHRDGTPTEHGFVSLLPAGDAVRAVWLDGRKFPPAKPGGHGEEEPEGEMTLRSARIAADGSLSEEAELDPRVCDCCQTGTAAGDDGAIVVYRDRSEKEIRDIGVARLEEGGWTAPATVAADGWEIPGCPVNGPSVVARGTKVVVAWFTAAEGRARVRVAFSGDGGRTFGAPLELSAGDPLGRVDVVLLDDGAALVSWMEASGKEADVLVARVTPSGEVGASMTVARTSAARASGFPRMVRSGRRVILAWTDVGARNQVKVAAATLP